MGSVIGYQEAHGPVETFDTDVARKIKKLEASIEPVQDLHGYDHPWPAGGGKNLIPLSLADIKAANVNGTWSENSYTYNGLTFSIILNENDEIVKITVNGTNTNSSVVNLYLGPFNSNSHLQIDSEKNYYISGGAAKAKMIAWRYDSSGNYIDLSVNHSTQIGELINNSESVTQYTPVIQIAGGVTVQSETVYPMVYIGTSQAPPFEPYSNICPITGWTGAKVQRTGKNLLQTPYYDGSKTEYGITYTVNNDGSISLSGTNNKGGTAYFNIVDRKFPKKLKKGRYSVGRTGIAGVIFGIVSRNADNTHAVALAYANETSDKVFTLSEDTLYYSYISIQAGVTVNATFYPRLELGSNATPYEPYVGSTYDITFPSEAGTVYGGKLDVVKGELVVDRAMVTNSNKATRYESAGGYYWYTTSKELNAAEIAGLNAKLISNRLNPENNVTTNSQEGRVSWYANNIIRWKERGELDQAEYLEYLVNNPLQFCYELATPITYQLTPQEINTIIGTNTIYADTGDTSVIYPKTITPVETVSNVNLMELRRNIIAAQGNDNLYDKWIWKQEKNDFVVRSNTVGFLEGLGNNIYADQRSDRENNRRSVVVKRGNIPFVAYDSVSGGSYTPVKLYPIPIPSNATSVQMSCDNDAQDLRMGAMLLRLENGVYKQIQNNTYSIDISRPLWLITGNHHYLAPYIQYGDNSNFANELENVQFTFSRIGALRWTLTGEDVVIRKRNIKWSSNDSYISFASENNVNNYLAVVTRRGLCGYASYDGSALNNESPIPIPPTATKVTVTTTPTLQTHLILLKCFDNQTQQLIIDNSWKSSPVTMTFDADDNLELAIALRVDSSASNFTTSTTPTEIIVQFE